MKGIKLPILLFLTLGIILTACKTEPDIYAPYKDITVVYGLLDSDKDTNYVKINKAFLGGNAYEIAMIADSCNYPGKLDCRIIEYRARAGANNMGEFVQTKVMPLDTITIHDKEQGFFYAPDQLVYYTTSRIHTNKDGYVYRYKLEIDRGDTLLTANTDIVGGDQFVIQTAFLTFASNTPQGAIKWYPCPNAAIYEVLIKFDFVEVNSAHDSVHRCMTMSLGTFTEAELENDNGLLVKSYRTNTFFTSLATFLGSDTLNQGIDRIVFEPSLTISIAAGGEELHNFIAVNGPSTSIVQSIPEYTNVTGGYGVFSSRTRLNKKVRMNSQTFSELMGHDNWRFRQGR